MIRLWWLVGCRAAVRHILYQRQKKDRVFLKINANTGFQTRHIWSFRDLDEGAGIQKDKARAFTYPFEALSAYPLFHFPRKISYQVCEEKKACSHHFF
jgi:hypothetical protein